LGILFTAFGMVGCFFIVNRMFWGRNTDVMDIRVTDDRFVIAVNIHEKQTDVNALQNLLVAEGALEVRERVKEI
jgi:flagellar biogenesis protein FliO